MGNIAKMDSVPQRGRTHRQTGKPKKVITGKEAVARGVRTFAGQSGLTVWLWRKLQ